MCSELLQFPSHHGQVNVFTSGTGALQSKGGADAAHRGNCF